MQIIRLGNEHVLRDVELPARGRGGARAGEVGGDLPGVGEVLARSPK